ncbi:CCA tRNA nucleotidyltransferase [Tetragenococcus koreensis]|uniref:CCA-adding enzyme n=1 Tax=Tetragenococcus koreensis TaxID=290335 RepID=A0AAN4RK62_9ENTE|nr:CCA tRNA nucleotidyltransferase [Tetragenococcus koreensis]MDN6278089.1 CCA tRNA nucleotidyltransferase [Lactococcus lactis]MCF1584142.1 CCA tRNA nucleotidyltransferase [Tetragenococcus koreensis]MCF1613725.1 CCA tRNA nucleotidyltransferase [Tetragenococcus koreensis]MCF1616233.1 CCA tRNA nucleotidyltransferase [Tetragenococcus koreensis]MCF1618951.1 CCA tRNA nucleotidyltransferase [Tetragenococcus koreensis]
MKLKKIPAEYQQALPILKKIEQAGHEAYFVGGSVRDVLLNQPIHDVDIATSAFPAEIKQIFSKTIDVGIEHGTVLVLERSGQYEITTFRTESIYQDFRRPEHVEFVRSLKEDLKRRDFTINAFAIREDGEIIDLFDGLKDLDDRILRAVGDPHERFYEDALRMMRGLRFVSQLGFDLEKETFSAIKENHQLLKKISIERINVEFVKLLLGNYRKKGVQTLVESQCFEYCPALAGKKEELLSFAALPEKVIKQESQAWVLLIDQLNLKEADIRPFLKEWKCSNEMIKTVQSVFYGLQIRKEQAFTADLLYQLGETQAILVEELLPFYGKTASLEKVLIDYHRLPIHSLKELAVNGNDLMTYFDKKPGKWLKEQLTSLEKAVIHQQVPNKKEELLQLAEQQQAK